MAGKNKLERGITIGVDDGASGTLRQLEGDMVPNSLNGLGFTAGAVDLTGTSDSVENVMGDRKKNTLKVKFHANNTATTGASTVLNAIVGLSSITVTVKIGSSGATPTTGDQQFSGEFTCLSATLSADGGKMVHDCEFQPFGSTPPSWSVI
jgi:hypothetical protein